MPHKDANQEDNKPNNPSGRPPKLWKIPDTFENVVKALVKPAKKDKESKE